MKKCHHKFLKESLEEFEYEVLDKFLETVEIKKTLKLLIFLRNLLRNFWAICGRLSKKKMGKIVKHVVKRIFGTCCIFGRNSWELFPEICWRYFKRNLHRDLKKTVETNFKKIPNRFSERISEGTLKSSLEEFSTDSRKSSKLLRLVF